MIAVKGKKEAVTIFTLLGDSNFKNNSEFKNLENKHKNILEVILIKDGKIVCKI